MNVMMMMIFPKCVVVYVLVCDHTVMAMKMDDVARASSGSFELCVVLKNELALLFRYVNFFLCFMST